MRDYYKVTYQDELGQSYVDYYDGLEAARKRVLELVKIGAYNVKAREVTRTTRHELTQDKAA
jgi:hypothetical protein